MAIVIASFKGKKQRQKQLLCNVYTPTIRLDETIKKTSKLQTRIVVEIKACLSGKKINTLNN